MVHPRKTSPQRPSEPQIIPEALLSCSISEQICGPAAAVGVTLYSVPISLAFRVHQSLMDLSRAGESSTVFSCRCDGRWFPTTCINLIFLIVSSTFYSVCIRMLGPAPERCLKRVVSVSAQALRAASVVVALMTLNGVTLSIILSFHVQSFHKRCSLPVLPVSK